MKRPPYLLVVVVYGALLPALVYSTPVQLEAILGSLLIMTATVWWGARAGTLAAVWATAVATARFLLRPETGELTLLSCAFTYFVLAIGVGKAFDVIRWQRDRLAENIAELNQAKEQLRASEEKYRTLIESVDDVIHVKDSEARYVVVNSEMARRLGCRKEDIVGKTALDLYPPEVARKILDDDTRVLRSGAVVEAEEVHPTPQGSRVSHVRKVPLRNSAGEVVGLVTVSRNITERKRAEEALRQANQQLTDWVKELEERTRDITLLNEMADLLQACFTAEEAYSIVSHMAQRLFPDWSGALFVLNASKNSVEAVAVWGQSPPLERVFAPDECWAFRRGRAHLAPHSDDAPLCHHVTRPVPDSYLCLPMMAQGEGLGTLHLRSDTIRSSQPNGASAWLTQSRQRLATTVAEHIALALANLRLRETLRNQAIRDPLTGLFNRRYMEETLEREVSRAQRRSVPLAIVMLDIDHFKRFNDVHGHQAGDKVLRLLGSFLQTHIRSEDIACRYGGEEFTLILPEAPLNAARLRAEQLLEGLRQLKVEHQHQTLEPVTLSAGVAAFPGHGPTGQAVLLAADAALYRAKAEGHARVVVATGDALSLRIAT